MKTKYVGLLLFLCLFSFAAELSAQYGYGGGAYGRRGLGGRQGRSTIPQAQSAPEPPKPKTAEEIVDEAMPNITEVLELNDFEVAVLGAILKKYTQERIEMQILKLSPEKTREGYESIRKRQDEELKAGLPPEKYEAFVKMQSDGIQQSKREKKKEKRKNKKKKQQ